MPFSNQLFSHNVTKEQGDDDDDSDADAYDDND